MTLPFKLKFLVWFVVALTVLAVPNAIRYHYSKITELGNEVAAIRTELKRERQFYQEFEQLQIELEDRREQRDKEFDSFRENLDELSKNNAELAAILSTVVPGNALDGLRSFRRGGNTIDNTCSVP